MSLLASMRRALTPKPAAPLPPATTMHIGGLQLECPVCSFDLFRHRQLLTSASQYGSLHLAVAAIACDRCGAIQLFDPGARSMPDLMIPPRRLGRRR